MKLRARYLIIGLCACVMFALMGCGDDSSEGTVEQRTHNLHLGLGSRQYDFSITRNAGDLPANFVNYETYRKRSDVGLPPFSQIQCYMTYWDTEFNKWDKVPCTFTYKATTDPNHTDTWSTRVPLKTLTGDKPYYYIYGFLPKENVNDEATIIPYNNDYEKGAVLTINGLNAVLPDDISIIVGAQGYGAGSAVPDMSTHLGQFRFQPGDGSADDYLFLLVDHLYAGLQFNMSLESKYSQLRKIKVTKIQMTPVSDSGQNNTVIATVDATVTIVANNDNMNPIVEKKNSQGVNISGHVDFVTHAATSAAPAAPAVLYEGEGKWLTTSKMPFLACFCPSTNRKFILETTYDVYDTQDNLIRKEQTASNTVKLEWNLNAGQIHTLNITVKPTYLYVLSEPDLDNPGFNVD